MRWVTGSAVCDMLAWIRARGAEVSAGAIDWDDQVQISAGMRTDLRVFVAGCVARPQVEAVAGGGV